MLAPWKKSFDQSRQCIKNRDITLLTKACIVKAMVFPVFMYRCKSWTVKKAEHQRIDAFELWCWTRLLRVPWTARSNQSILKEISPEYSLEGLMLKLKLQYFGHLIQRADSLEKPWCWERLKAGGEGDNRGWDGWMASLTQWTWVWASSWRWWRTGKPSVLLSMGSQRVGHDSNWTTLPKNARPENRSGSPPGQLRKAPLSWIGSTSLRIPSFTQIRPQVLLATQSLGCLSGQVPSPTFRERDSGNLGLPNYVILLLQELHSFCSNLALLQLGKSQPRKPQRDSHLPATSGPQAWSRNAPPECGVCSLRGPWGHLAGPYKAVICPP